MRCVGVAVAAVLGGLMATGTMAATTYDPTGLWLTANERAVIRIARCEAGLCGRIHWIVDGGMQYDSENPDPAKRDRPMCGLRILWGVEQQTDEPNAWENGTVYKADSGDEFGLDLKMKGPDKLKLRGYVGISLLGKSQVWTRVTREQYPRCEPPEA
jgi:uncharacterized protein (DUF2147 family)